MSNATLIDSLVPGSQEIVLSRTFDAPKALVFRALTDPESIPKWWGPRRYETAVDVMEPRFGGRWRFVHHDATGRFHAFHGVYHAVEAPDRIVYTFEYEGVPGHVLLATQTLEEVDGRTTLTETSVFQSVADRDGMVAAGMESGATESMDRLGELLETMR